MKYLTLVPIGGLANRMLAVMSAIALCKDYSLRLKVIWFKDWGMGADFHSLFEFTGFTDNIEIKDATWMDYRFDRPRKRNLWLPCIWQYFCFDHRIYEREVFLGLPANQTVNRILNHTDTYLVHYSTFYGNDLFRFFSPRKEIRAMIDQETASFPNSRVIGLHIRRGDHAISSTNSPLSLFLAVIEKELDICSDTLFYVASDSYEEKRKIKAMYGDRIHTSFKEVRRDTKDSIIDALVELYALSSTEKIYGSEGSTYSFVAAQLSGIPFEVLSLEKTEIPKS